MINKATSAKIGLVGAMRSLAMPLFMSMHATAPVLQIPGKSEYKPDPTEPSLFTRGGGVHPRWVRWFMMKYGLNHQMAMNIGTALHTHLTAEPQRYIDYDDAPPAVSLEDEALVSMAFVMDYRHRYNVSFQVAYTMGYSELFGPRSVPGRYDFLEVSRDGDTGCTATVIPFHQ